MPFDPEKFVEEVAGDNWSKAIHESWAGDSGRCGRCGGKIRHPLEGSTRRGVMLCKKCHVEMGGKNNSLKGWAKNTPSVQRERYEKRKAAGLCVRCAAPAAEGKVQCVRCLGRAKRYPKKEG